MAEEPPPSESTDGEGGAESPAPSPWLRLRRTSVIRADKIVQIRIQRREDDFFLEIRADRDIYIPVQSRSAGVRALEAIADGADDISEWTVPRSLSK